MSYDPASPHPPPRRRHRALAGVLLAAASALALAAAVAAPGVAHAARAPALPQAPAASEAETPVFIPGAAVQPAVQPATGYAFWAGHGVTADAGVTLTEAAVTMTVPYIDCGNTVIGTSGYSVTDYWVGLDGYGTSDVEQDGLEVWCTGTADDYATGGPYYTAWYDTFPDGGFTSFASQPALAAGNTLDFSTTYNPTAGTDKYVYTDVSDSSWQTSATVTCPAGQTCGGATAEVITEAPGGGPPAYPMDASSASGNGYIGNYSSALIKAGATSGTLNTLASEWTATGDLDQNFGGPPPTDPLYTDTIAGNYATGDTGYGEPGTLGASGKGFATPCEAWSNGGENTVVACVNATGK